MDGYTGTATTAAPGPGPGSAVFMAGLLQATLSMRKVTSIVAPCVDLPQLQTFTVSLGLGELPERVERCAGALALAAGADSCRISRAGGRLVLELAKPEAERKVLRATRLEGLPPPAPTAVALGLNTSGSVTWLDIADERNAHVLIGGVTGSGKTESVRWLLTRLIMQNAPEHLRLLLVDPKRSELGAFSRVPHLMHPIVSDRIDIARLMAWLVDELDRRLATGQSAPRLLVVLEETPDVLTTVPGAGGLLARLAQVGRSAGIMCIATAQQPGSKALADSLQNWPCRLIGRIASATLTYGASGRGRTQAHELLGRGDMLLLAAGSAVRLQVPLTDGRQLSRLPAVDQVHELDLPYIAAVADAGRDRRGGAGRRALTDADYARADQVLRAGGSADDLRALGIGYTRARRMADGYGGEE